MTLMTPMTAWWLLRFFVYDKKKAKPDALSSARLLPYNPRYMPLTRFHEKY